jgi:hypothetical protein
MTQTGQLGTTNTLSDAEAKLFKALGEGWMIPLITNGQLNITNAYEQAGLELFMKGDEGDKQTANALRRAIRANRERNPHRMTPMFDALVTIKNKV